MERFELKERVHFFEHGQINIDRIKARQILGTPHYIETDGTRTAGGEEDHWIFKSADDVIVFLNLRVPYNNLSLFFTVNEKFNFKKFLPKGLHNFNIEQYDQPYELL